MTAFNARHFMEMAVDVMHNSIAEPRTDGKASPKVGAVLVNVSDAVVGRRVDTAYRGELRHGDHAEFTLLERKNRDKKLDECVLFATLEPCAPRARKFPKLGCAERIVLARIKKVWIGIEDPDPTVDRKGIKYLQDNGIEVEMFDPDLQEIIRTENKDFIEQALERKAVVEQRPKRVVLSPLEAATNQVDFADFSTDALDSYRSLAKVSQSIDAREFSLRLVRQGLMKRRGDRFVATGFGLLLFGSEPRLAMPQSGLLATMHYSDGTEEVETFDGPMVLIPELALDWLRNKLPNVIDRSTARRREAFDALFILLREGLVNALVHRDYSIEGAKCQLAASQHKIDIWSPGQPVEPITLEQLQSFNAPVLSRNPQLHYVFSKMGLAEERGLGLKSMRELAQAAGLPLPKYKWVDPYVVLTVFASARGVTATLDARVAESLSGSELKGWQWLTTKGKANTPEYAEAIGVDERTGRRHLQRFVELGLARVIGRGRATKYEVK